MYNVCILPLVTVQSIHFKLFVQNLISLRFNELFIPSTVKKIAKVERVSNTLWIKILIKKFNNLIIGNTNYLILCVAILVTHQTLSTSNKQSII